MTAPLVKITWAERIKDAHQLMALVAARRELAIRSLRDGRRLDRRVIMDSAHYSDHLLPGDHVSLDFGDVLLVHRGRYRDSWRVLDDSGLRCIRLNDFEHEEFCPGPVREVAGEVFEFLRRRRKLTPYVPLIYNVSRRLLDEGAVDAMTGMILATECHDGQVTDPKLAVRLLGEIAKGGQNDQG